MKKISFILLFTLALMQGVFAQDIRKQAPSAGPAPKIEIGKYDKFTLSNGLKVILVENHKIPKVSFQLFIDADPVMEKDAAGYVDMAGQLLSCGTKTRTKAQIDKETDFLGASLSSSGSGMFAVCLKKHTPKLLDLMSDILLNPSFPTDEFDKLRKQTISGLQSQKDDPNAIAGNVGRMLAYGKEHPYGEVTTEQTVNKIDLEQCKAYYQTYFKPNIAYLVVVGDINRAETEKYANQYFGAWKKGDVPTHSYAQPEAPKETTVDFVNKTGAVQSVINITYPFDLKPNSPDVIKTKVMNTLLGGYFRSRINDNLREKRAYTYGAGSRIQQDKLISGYSTYGSFRNVVTDSSVQQFIIEMNRMTTDKVEDKELNMVKNVMSGNFARSLEEAETVANFALNIARYGLPADYYDTYLQNISKVTPDDVFAMAKKYIHPDHAHIVVVGNKGDVAEKLAVFAKNGKVNYYDIYGNLIQDSGAKIPDGVTAQTIISDYLAAIGGSDKLAQIKDLTRIANMEMQGMKIQMTTYQKAPDKFALNVSMNGMVMQSQVVNGNKGVASQMGQTKPVEGDELEDLKSSAQIIPEMHYGEWGCKMELKGIENINGSNAYEVVISWPKGKTATSYFDMKSSMKVREVEVQGTGEEKVTITSDYKDFKDVDGFKFPFTIEVSGMAPVPVTLSAESIKINSGVDEAVFKVD